ncbi:HAD-IB family hydrolase [Aquibacillus halophilus]|uniref:HAD-IB family hydrolase n=1 Tax=Aquibacillus halophilus TaxID=930132 RepID=A0A6A8D6G6_9BACI|nr:HAD family hydrolase [Aquibacillus halophilus]MRH41333.1 HAD-IB family hydrolase [Aquibacillus halophilus]
MAIVTVDFDGTLYQGNSFKVMFEVGKNTFAVKQWGVLFIGLVKAAAIMPFKGKNASKHQFFKAFARTFKGKTRAELDLFFQELVDIGKQDVHQGLVLKIREHQKKGDTIIVLSGALNPFLKAFTKDLELDVHVISTELLYNEKGLCTGEIGKIINGDEKVKKVQEWIEHQEILADHTISDIWAYADSESDIPLLNYVQHPIVVNPDQDMKKIADRNNWPIFAS